jgi:uncharacterized protein (TIGR03435 family)
MVSARASALLLLVLTAAFGQTPPEPRFDVATIKATISPAEFRSQGKAPPRPVSDAGQVRIYSTFSGLLRRAFRLETYQKVTGPDWIDTAWFEIVAKLPEGASQDQIPEMLKTLLSERLQVVAKRQSRLESVYTLTVSKEGLKLKEVPPGFEPSAKFIPVPGQVLLVHSGALFYSRLNGAVILDSYKVALPDLASALRKEAGLPVIDKTGLPGFYSVSLAVPGSWLNNATSGDPSGVDLFKSIEKLGLHLEKDKVAIDSLVVEHAERVPSGN